MAKNQSLEMLIVGNRIPQNFFISKGHGESDIAVHAGSYHLALRAAGVERFNHMVYSSILPAIAHEVSLPKDYEHGAVLESIAAVANSGQGERATAGIIYAWLYERRENKKFGGLVCEYDGHDSKDDAQKSLRASLQELYENGFSERYKLEEPNIITESFVPQKKYGTAVVVMGFTSYRVPIIEAQ